MTKEDIIKLINKNKRLFEAEDFDAFFEKIAPNQRKDVAQFLMGDVGYPLLNNMTVIPEAFLYRTELTSITIPSNIKEVKKNAFAKSALQKVTFENGGVQEIGQKAFEHCFELKDVVLPDTLKAIPKECFSACTSLKKVVMPASVMQIGTGAFKDCPETLRIITPKGGRGPEAKKLRVAQSDIPFFRKVFTDQDVEE